MTSERSRALGEDLARQREAGGVSLEDMSRDTKIRHTLLEAIEAGRFEEMPPDVFVVGFIKAYCRRLEIDAAPFVTRFTNLKAIEPENAGEDTPGTVLQEQARPAWMVWAIVLVLLAALVFAALWWLGYFPYDSGLSIQGPPAPKVEENTIPEVPLNAAPPPAGSAANAPEESKSERSPSSTPSPPQVKDPSSGERAAALHSGGEAAGSLVVTCMKPCWLELWVDGKREVYRLLSPGEKLSFEGKRYRADIGNSAGVEILYKGRPVRLPSGEGRVVKGLLIPESSTQEGGQ